MLILFLIYLFVSLKMGWGILWYDWLTLTGILFLTCFAEKIRMNLAIIGYRMQMQRETNYVKNESKEDNPFNEIT